MWNRAEHGTFESRFLNLLCRAARGEDNALSSSPTVRYRKMIFSPDKSLISALMQKRSRPRETGRHIILPAIVASKPMASCVPYILIGEPWLATHCHFPSDISIQVSVQRS